MYSLHYPMDMSSYFNYTTLARPTGVLFVDLKEFYERLQQSVPRGKYSYSPLLFLSYLSKDRILLPSLREQHGFQHALEDILLGYLQTIPEQRRVSISGMNPTWYEGERCQVKTRYGHFTDATNHSLLILERMMFIRNLLIDSLA